MSNSLVVKGSLQDIAKRTGSDLKKLFIDVELVVLLDTSFSMSALDGTESSRYERAVEDLKKLQAQHPGQIALISFSSESEWCLGGVPTFRGNTTDMAGGLRFAKQVDNPYVTFVIISDGCPNSESETLEVAATVKAQINTVYVGPENGPGIDFLKKLATSKRGNYHLNQFALGLSDTMQKMLPGAL